MFQDTHP